jgi:hypothetical protein
VFTSVGTLLHSFHHPKQGWIAIVMAIGATLASSLAAFPAEPNRGEAVPDGRLSPTPSRATALANGVYLYGETARPNVVGKEYIVFETIGTKARGAFYLPRSEFSCFYGQLKGARLNVTVIDPFDRQKYSFSLTVNSNGLNASKQPKSGQATYQPLDKISSNDLRILAACKSQLPK